MNTNQNKPPLNSFHPADQVAARNAGEISPDADNLGQIRTGPCQEAENERTMAGEISPGADNLGQIRTGLDSEVDDEAVDGSEIAPASARERFSRADELLVLDIARGSSMRDVATRAGVSERTVRRRWADPKFRKKVFEARSEIRCEATGRLTTEMNKATETLTAGMNAKSESVRVSAARAILKIGEELGGRAEETALLAEKLERVESVLAQTLANRQE
jgi:hypothetical protein